MLAGQISNEYTLVFIIDNDNDFCQRESLLPSDLTLIDGWVHNVYFGEKWYFSLADLVDEYGQYFYDASVQVQSSFI